MIKKYRIEDFKGGWFVGKFEPSLYKDRFEVGYKKHKKGDNILTHYHRIGTEITCVIKGKLKINGMTFESGDVFVVEPFKVTEIEILEDIEVIVVKTFSGQYDKVEIE